MKIEECWAYACQTENFKFCGFDAWDNRYTMILVDARNAIFKNSHGHVVTRPLVEDWVPM